MKPGPAQSRKKSADREVHEQLIVRWRGGLEDPRNLDERDPRHRGADDGQVLSHCQSESAQKALSRVRRPISIARRLDPYAALEGEERDGVGGTHDDRLSVERPEAQDLGAHDSRPRLRGEIVREALVDRVGPASLRHEIRITREDVSRHAGKSGEDRPCGPEEECADHEAGEGTRSDQDGTAPFVRTRTAARRDGTRPAKPAAAKEIRSA